MIPGTGGPCWIDSPLMSRVEPHKVVQHELEPGESVLWTGRPCTAAYVLGSIMATAPLGLIAAGSAVSWTRGEQILALPAWVHALLALVALFALHMLAVRPLLSLHIARRTAYAITDRRALVVCHGLGRRVQQLPHGEGELVVVPGLGSYGKIQFGRIAGSSLDVLVLGRAAVPGFYGLSDLKTPLSRLRELRGEHDAQD